MKTPISCEIDVAGTVYRLEEGKKVTVGLLTLSDGRTGEIRVGMGGVVPTCWVAWPKPPKEKKAPQGRKKRRTGQDTCCFKCARRNLEGRDGYHPKGECTYQTCMEDPEKCGGRTNGGERCAVCQYHKETL